MTNEKYAVLDTDFISKTHLIRKDDQNTMIDRIMEMQEYRFYCHEQVRAELEKHNISDSSAWLEDKISDGSVQYISDETILNELFSVCSRSALIMYVNMLRNRCAALKQGYFEENFTRLKVLDFRSITKESFFQMLKRDCDDIGKKKSLGELKSCVLFQLLSTKLGKQIYIFCSDD